MRKDAVDPHHNQAQQQYIENSCHNLGTTGNNSLQKTPKTQGCSWNSLESVNVIKKKEGCIIGGLVSSTKTDADLCFRKSPCVSPGRKTAKGIKIEKMDLYP